RYGTPLRSAPDRHRLIATDTAPARQNDALYGARPGWLCCGRKYGTWKSGLHRLQQANHFEGGHGGFFTFVARFGAGTFNGLFDGIDGQYTEGHRNTEFQRYGR